MVKIMKTQKELKELLKNEYELIWENDPKMVNYCMKKAAYVVEIKTEKETYYLEFEKPEIQKEFCFGYGLNGITNAEEMKEALENADTARNSYEWFINANLKQIEESIEFFRNEENIVAAPAYYKHDRKIVSVHSKRTHINYYNNLPIIKELNEQEKQEIINGWEVVKQDFMKRLNIYLKRYGLSKVNSWTYLVD